MNETLRPSYNYFLYETRKKRDISRLKFARFLGIGLTRYRMIENGYLKPNAEDVKKISAALEIDYSQYLEGESSYPTEIPEKEQRALSRFLYNLLGKKWLRITLGALSFLFIGAFAFGLSAERYVSNHSEQYYAESVIRFNQALQEKGKTNISLAGELTYPQISAKTVDDEENTEKLVQISGSYTANNYDFRFKEFYWTDTYRLEFSFTNVSNGGSDYYLHYFDYETSIDYMGIATVGDTISVYIFLDEAPAFVEAGIKAYLEANDINDDFNNLIHDQLSLDYDFRDEVVTPLKEGNEKIYRKSLIYWSIYIIGLVFGILSLFGTAFALIYGQSDKEQKIFHHGDELIIGSRSAKPFKNDFRFFPFLPETLIEIIGILLVAFGSLRVIMLATSLVEYSSDVVAASTGELLSIQMLGMFLLYFVDFDLFMDDRRVLRNIVLYALMFLGIYFVEASVLTGIRDSKSLIANFVRLLNVPNPFGSVCCYFSLMAFLFFTPKRIKTKRGLILYRCLAVLPIAYTITAWFIFHGDYFFKWDMSNLWFRYFFDSERLPFSILAIAYLVGLFFLRLFFKLKYGEEGAQRYFHGNRFLLLKNAWACLVVLAVWIIELRFSGNASLHKIGIGNNVGLIILIPFLFFYHPHKGPRNLPVDYTTLFLYFAALIYAYVIAAIVGLVGLLA